MVSVTARTKPAHGSPGADLHARDRIPEVVQVYRMGCETDYLLRIVVSDIDDYDRV
jgi:DNA-binding Lrp family transcriptional regulator